MAKANESTTKAPMTNAARPNTVLLELPFGALGPGYVSNRVDAHLTPKQAETLRRITAGLEERGARLESGILVNDGPKAVRYMLEQIVLPE